MRCIRPAIVGITLALLVSLVTVQPSSAGATIDPIAAARNWLVAQQQPDGDFELADVPRFRDARRDPRHRHGRTDRLELVDE